MSPAWILPRASCEPSLCDADAEIRHRRIERRLEGRRLVEVFPGAEGESLLERARETGEPASWRERPCELPERSDRGPSWWDWTVTPVKDGRGDVQGLVLSLRDATERVVSRRRVEESEAVARAWAAELEAVMDSVPAAVQIAHDAAATHITGSRAAYELMRMPYGSNVSMSGESPPTHFRVLGPDRRELSPPELPIQRAASTGAPVRDAQITLAFDDGTECPLLGNATPLFGAAGEVRGAVGAFLDVTERLRAEAALREVGEVHPLARGRHEAREAAVHSNERLLKEILSESGITNVSREVTEQRYGELLGDL